MTTTITKPTPSAITGPATLRRHLLALVQAATPSHEEHAHDRWQQASERTQAGSAFFHDLIAAIQSGLDMDGVVALCQFAAIESTKAEAICRAEARHAWQLWLDEYAVLHRMDPEQFPCAESMPPDQIIAAVIAEGDGHGTSMCLEPPRVRSRQDEFNAMGGDHREEAQP